MPEKITDSKTIKWVVLAIIIIAATFGGFFIYKHFLKIEKPETPVPSASISSSASPSVSPSETSSPSATTASKPSPTPTTLSRPFREPINKEVSLGNPNRKQIAITLDAGASATQTPAILQILKENDIHLTFFTTGRWAEQNPNLIKQMIADGHTLGNHTYSHPYLTQISDEKILEEFQRTESIIQNLVGTTTKPYFRAPYGNRNQHVWDVAGSAGYQSIYWTVDALDWQEGATNDSVKTRVYDNIKNSAIVLMHVGDDITSAVLPDIIKTLEDRGYELVTIDKLLS